MIATAGAGEDHERDDGRDEVGDRHGDAAPAEREVALDERHRRLEDVGHQPGDEQDDRRRDEDREELGRQREDDADEGEDDEPEQQPRLAPRDDSSEQRRGTLGRHGQTVAYGAHLIG